LRDRLRTGQDGGGFFGVVAGFSGSVEEKRRFYSQFFPSAQTGFQKNQTGGLIPAAVDCSEPFWFETGSLENGDESGQPGGGIDQGEESAWLEQPGGRPGGIGG
jgi:hypothetical protein